MQEGISLRWSFRSIAPALCAEGTNWQTFAFTSDGFRRLRRGAILSAWVQALADVFVKNHLKLYFN
jgi:hypothetical protein